jgi:hypothetical protein
MTDVLMIQHDFSVVQNNSLMVQNDFSLPLNYF